MNIIVYNYYYWYDFCDCYYCIRAGIAQWLERRTRDRKVACSSPGRSGGRINLASPGTTFCADSYFAISSNVVWYTYEIPVILPKLQVEGYS